MFHKLADAVNAQFTKMQKENSRLYRVDLDKEMVWDKYISSFPESTNPIFQEQTEHDCNTCKNFIRDIGNVVAIVDNKLVSIWDVNITAQPYSDICKTLSDLVKSQPINNIFINNEPKAGKQHTPALLKNGSAITFNHFYADIETRFYNRDVANTTHPIRTNAQMLERAMEELTLDAAETILDLINQNSIYRGSEYKDLITRFIEAKHNYINAPNKNLFIWKNIDDFAICRVRNSVIGSLLTDLSQGRELKEAVKSFEAKVAPLNYKRPTALITPKMVELAVAKIKELNIEDSLRRRYAHLSDITINNVIFANKDTAQAMKDPLTAMLMTQTKASKKTFDKVEEISIDDFIANVVPTASTIEAYIENQHIDNLVSLIAPEVSDSKNILQWNNNFSWAYHGGVTDSIKERVKEVGGNVEADLRISLSWTNDDDLDLHCHTANGKHIYYGNKTHTQTRCRLDIDMMRGGTPEKPSVENIFWVNERDIEHGTHLVAVNQYAKRTSSDQGYTVQVDFKGQTWEFNSATNGSTTICNIIYDGKDIKVEKLNANLTESATARQEWGIKANEFIPVSTMMYSPNFWDENHIGNKHYMFMLKDCKNPESIRGLYNEFLSNKLTEHRKVFEVLGDKMKCEYSDNQLSGVGFSSTNRNSLICKVTGNVTRLLKINF